MQIPQPILLTVTLVWIAAAIGLIAFHRRQVTILKCVFAAVFCAFGAASASYCFLHWSFEMERDSAAHLVGVAHLRLGEDVAFLRSQLGPVIEFAESDQEQESVTFDWTATFQLKHQDILTAMDDVVENDCIQQYYSVWVADVAFHKTRLEMLATKVITLTEPKSRRATFDTYADAVERASQFLGELASRMRSESLSEYFGNGN